MKKEDALKPVSALTEYLEKHIEPSSIAYLCVESLTSLSHAELMKCKLFGWNPEPLIDLCKKVNDEISKT